MASARSALALTLRPVSVIVGLVAAAIASSVIEFGALMVTWFAHQPATGLLWWTISLVVVLVGRGVGGYVAARLSRSRGFAAAVTVGVMGLLPPLVSSVLDPSDWWHWWMTAAYLALFVPAAAVGGWLAIRGRGETLEDDTLDPDGLGLVQP